MASLARTKHTHMNKISQSNTIENALQLLPEFEALVKEIAYEDRGIFFSELLFLRAAADGIKPLQVLESGRARGVSTNLLCSLFPDSRVISLEYEYKHQDAMYAERALAHHRNLALLYGDSTVVLPELLLPGDIVLIDGPKGMAAVNLALRSLATGRPAAVFIHDCFRGQKGRKFLDQHVPTAFYSDDSQFVANFRHLDDAIWKGKRVSSQDEKYGSGEAQSYGPTLACIPHMQGVDYYGVSEKIQKKGLLARIGRVLGKS